MTMKINQPFYPHGTQTVTRTSPATGGRQPSVSKSDRNFRQMLHEAMEQPTVKFSQHARQRLQEYDIEITDATVEKLNEGLEKAAAKGARESMFLLDNLTFIVSVPKSTVITVMEQNNMKDQVVTNIDSAVWLSS